MDRKRRAVWLILTAAMAALDLWSKALWRYPPRLDTTRFAVVEDWLYVWAVWNEGGVWSLDLPQWLLLGATLIAVPLLTWWIFAPKETSHKEVASKALVLAGAIGNLVDRWKWAKVRDWIDVCFGDVEGYHYPTFNVADAALVIGIAVLLILSFRARKTKEAE